MKFKASWGWLPSQRETKLHHPVHEENDLTPRTDVTNLLIKSELELVLRHNTTHQPPPAPSDELTGSKTLTGREWVGLVYGTVVGMKLKRLESRHASMRKTRGYKWNGEKQPVETKNGSVLPPLRCIRFESGEAVRGKQRNTVTSPTCVSTSVDREEGQGRCDAVRPRNRLIKRIKKHHLFALI